MTLGRHVGARLARHARDLRSMATLRRREKRIATYLLRLVCLGLLLVALPAQKIVQLGPLGALLAAVKLAAALALVVGLLAAFHAVEWLARRRRHA